MSVPGDLDVAIPIPAASDDESALFSTANNLLGVLTTRLKDRPHGQISLVQLPDVFLIKAHLEQLVELEAKKVKHQETLIQMAMDREEEGVKGAKKRVKNTGTQATALRQAVAVEVEEKTADLQRRNADMENRMKKMEKLLETSTNKNMCLEDKVNFLATDFNKFSKAPTLAVQKSLQDALMPVEQRLVQIEEKSEFEARGDNDMRGRLEFAEGGILGLLRAQKKVTEDLQHEVTKTNTRLGDVVDVFNKNCGLVEGHIWLLVDVCRGIQAHIGVTLMDRWRSQLDMLHSKFFRITPPQSDLRLTFLRGPRRRIVRRHFLIMHELAQCQTTNMAVFGSARGYRNGQEAHVWQWDLYTFRSKEKVWKYNEKLSRGSSAQVLSPSVLS